MLNDDDRKKATSVDLRVGGRIRLRRKLIGMTQVQLGGRIGITSQQVQKYEKGVNRIGASRLERIAHSLGVPTSHFFEDVDTPPSPFDGVLDRFLQLSESAALVSAFVELRDPAVRRQVVDIVRSLKVIADAARGTVGAPPREP